MLKGTAVYSRPAAVIRARAGCRHGGGWNGRTAQCVFFSGEEPESLRGPQCELCIIDEIARMRYQQSVFDTMMLGLRLGDRPRVLLATTPRTTPFMKRLVAMDDVRVTTGSTYDNAEHLSADFLKKVRELYEGTRLGRQELQGLERAVQR
jgi:phage terminase large subunit-like protein